VFDLVISISHLRIKLRTELSRTQCATMVIMKRVSKMRVYFYKKFIMCFPFKRERQTE